MIAEPPVAPAAQETLMAPFCPARVSADGTDGVVFGVALTADDAELPRAAPFVAVTVKV